MLSPLIEEHSQLSMDAATAFFIFGKGLKLPLLAHTLAIIHSASEGYLALCALLNLPFLSVGDIQRFYSACESPLYVHSCTILTSTCTQ